MKTALDLPDELAREVKIRAAQEGRKLKDVVADLIRVGLDAARDPMHDRQFRLAIDEVSGLPVVSCSQPTRPNEQLTPNKVASILLDQEVAWNHEAGR